MTHKLCFDVFSSQISNAMIQNIWCKYTHFLLLLYRDLIIFFKKKVFHSWTQINKIRNSLIDGQTLDTELLDVISASAPSIGHPLPAETSLGPSQASGCAPQDTRVA